MGNWDTGSKCEATPKDPSQVSGGGLGQAGPAGMSLWGLWSGLLAVVGLEGPPAAGVKHQ